MEITQSILEKCTERITDKELQIEDIPKINLYAKQVISLLNEKLPHRREEGDVITNAMINNYTKEKLLNPPENKMYNQDQVILLSLIYHLKQVLSLSDIRALFNKLLLKDKGPIFEDENDSPTLISLAYSCFLALQKAEHDDLCRDFQDRFNIVILPNTKKIEDHDRRKVAEKLLTILLVAAQAVATKQLAEELIKDFCRPEE